jgi:hypothetical protein
MVNPKMKKELRIRASKRLSFFPALPPVTTDRYAGSKGRVQGEKNETRPPAKAPSKPMDDKDSNVPSQRTALQAVTDGA